jgi:hypothetical protein
MMGIISGITVRNYEDKLAELGLKTRRRNADLFTMHKRRHGVRDE